MRFKVVGRAVHDGAIDLATYETMYANFSAAVRRRARSEPEFESYVGSSHEPGYIRSEWLTQADTPTDAQRDVIGTLEHAMTAARFPWPEWSVLTNIYPWPRGLEWDD